MDKFSTLIILSLFLIVLIGVFQAWEITFFLDSLNEFGAISRYVYRFFDYSMVGYSDSQWGLSILCFDSFLLVILGIINLVLLIIHERKR